MNKGDITTDTAQIQRIIGVYYEQLNNNKLDNPLEKMGNSLEIYNLSRLNQKEKENLKRPNANKGIN